MTRFQRFVSLLLALCLWLFVCPASAAKLVSTAGLGETVEPVRVRDHVGGLRPNALTDGRAITSYCFTGWRHQLNNDEDAVSFDFSGDTITGMWMRCGDLTSEATYYSHARPKAVKVTITCADGTVGQHIYEMEDRYDMSTRSDDWYEGYQRMAFPRTYYGVRTISLHIRWYEGSEQTNSVHISDVAFNTDGSRAPSYSSSSSPRRQLTGTCLETLYTRSGPSTTYDELGGYLRAGDEVSVISAGWDTRNQIWWLQCDVNQGTTKHRRIYTGLKRISINFDRVPQESLLGSVRVNRRVNAYYGPGTDYQSRGTVVPVGQVGDVYNIENGYVQFEYKPSGKKQLCRLWLPEDAVDWQ